MLLLLSNDPSEEPRMQINDQLRTQMVFGVDVDGLKPEQAVTVDASAWGYPIRSLRDVPASEYYVQALLVKIRNVSPVRRQNREAADGPG